ncbi:MAG: GNAT family N-acetyltransferase [Terriglobus roseus]|nr:GNAT family N-acetyltransferase [Terriglobus roseus]
MFPMHDHAAMESWYAQREARDFDSPGPPSVVAARDPLTGRLAGYARWLVPSAGRDSGGELKVDDMIPIAPPAGTDVDFLRSYYAMMLDGSKPHMDMARDWTVTFFAVHPDFEGRGYGGALMRHVLAEADQAGVNVFLIATDAGKRLYEKNGFSDVGELPIHLPNDKGVVTRHHMIRKAKHSPSVS